MLARAQGAVGIGPIMSAEDVALALGSVLN